MLAVLEPSCGFLRFAGLLSNEMEKRGAAQAYYSFIQLPTAIKHPQVLEMIHDSTKDILKRVTEWDRRFIHKSYVLIQPLKSGRRGSLLKKFFSAIMVIFLLAGMSTTILNIQPIEAVGTVFSGMDRYAHLAEVPVRTVDNITHRARATNAKERFTGTCTLDESGDREVAGPKFAPGEIIVKFRSNMSEENIGDSFAFAVKPTGELNRRCELKGVEEVSSKTYKLVFSEDVDVTSIIRQFEADPNVEYAEPNYILNTCVVPNDPNYTLQWAHQVIQSESAWDIEKGDENVVIAIVDTGVNWAHPDLAANIWINKGEMIDGTDNDGNGFVDDVRGWDFVDNDNDPMEPSEDPLRHGTLCAGIAAAVANNGIGIAGVCWGCKIMPVRAGYGYYVYLDSAAEGIRYAADNGADIISMSWGISGYYLSTLFDAIEYAYGKGVLLVASVGNEATSQLTYPAAFDSVVAVAATDQADKPAEFSNFGEWIEVAAPGVEIYSTWLDDSYQYQNGTSMSCPLVAGVAALIWSRFPNMTRDRARLQLRHTADDLGDPGFDSYYGYGRVNARRAVEQGPADHDVLISRWEKPRYVKPGNMAEINVTVFNLGESSEGDIQVQLLVDGTIVDSAVIDHLDHYTSGIASCKWIPALEGTYNVTSHVVPVPGETVVSNNVVSAHVVVSLRISVPDIFPTIRDAIDAANSGDTIFVSEGTYAEGQINVDKPLTLLANGTAIVDGLQKGHVFYVTASNVTVNGFMILDSYAQSTYYAGVCLDKVQNCKIESNTIANTCTGIFVKESHDNYIYANNITKDASEDYWGWCGIRLEDSGGNTLGENNVSGCEFNLFILGEARADFIQDIDTSNIIEGKPAYYLINRENIVIDPSTFPAVGYLAIIDSKNVTVKDLTLTNNGQGVLIVNVSDSVVKNATITGNWFGIDSYDSRCNLITGNNISENEVGIEAQNFEDSEITGNMISNNDWGGVKLSGSNNVLSRNNITLSYYSIDLYRSLFWGVLSNNNTIFSNNISGNEYGINLDGCEQSYISENIINANSAGGILLKGSSYNTVSSNEITECGYWLDDYAIELTTSFFAYSDNNTIVGNNVTRNKSGIRIAYSWYNTVAENTVADSMNVGVQLETSRHTVLRNNTIAGSKYNFGVFTGLDEVYLPTYTQDIDTSNTINGKPIYYLLDQKDLLIDSSDIGYLALVNCTNITVRNLSLTDNGQGLLLAFTSNSTIQNVTVAHNRVGIHVLGSDGNTIAANSILDNQAGVNMFLASSNNITGNSMIGNGISVGTLVFGWGTMWTSEYVLSEGNNINWNKIHGGGIGLSNPGATGTLVANNEIDGNGILLEWRSGNNILTGNNIVNGTVGIELDGSSNNTLRNNHMSGNQFNFALRGNEASDFVNDVDDSNTVDGKTVCYWIEKRDEVVPADAGYVALVNSHNITVRGLQLENNWEGILLFDTTASEIVKNNITENEVGIVLFSSSNNSLYKNNIENNYHGIELADSSENSIYHNNFVTNSAQVLTLNSTNVWHDGYPSGGNYWSDYDGSDSFNGPYQNLTGTDGIGDVQYVINVDNADRYPLMPPYVALLGDLNGDQKVNLKDVMMAVQAFNSFRGYPRWNADADLDGSGRVDMKDILTIVLNFNKS